MNRNLFLVAASLFIWGIGEGLFIYFQPLYLQEWGSNPVMIGEIYSAMGIAMAAAQIPSGYFSDRFGSHSIMLASWILGTIATWIMAIAWSLPTFVLGIILYGLTGFVVAPMNSYITSVRGNMGIGRAISLCSGLFNLGAVVGPVTGGFIADRFGFKMIYIFAGVLFLISTIIIFLTAKKTEPHHADQVSTQPKGIMSNYRFLAFLVLTGITMFALYLPQPLTPNFLQNQQQLSPTTIGILGALGSLGNAVAMLVFGNLNAFTGFLVGQVWMFIFAFIYLKGDSAIWFGLGYFFMGGYRLCRSMVLAVSRNLVHPGQTGIAFGMIETANSVAVITAPILAGVLYSKTPYSMYSVSAWLITAVILLNLIILYTIQRKKNNKHESAY